MINENIIEMRTQLFLGLTLLVLSGCSSVEQPTHSVGNLADKLGYLGFKDQQVWAIQFNDCTVYDRSEALKYLWFDRTLIQISCYRFKPSDVQALPTSSIRIHVAPKLSANVMEIERFEEMSISKSGWGSFPPIYEEFLDSSQATWLRVKEGWFRLDEADKAFVRFYSGSQEFNADLRAKHDAYFEKH